MIQLKHGWIVFSPHPYKDGCSRKWGTKMILSGWLLVESELKFAMGCRLLNDHLEKGPSGPFLLNVWFMVQ